MGALCGRLQAIREIVLITWSFRIATQAQKFALSAITEMLSRCSKCSSSRLTKRMPAVPRFAMMQRQASVWYVDGPLDWSAALGWISCLRRRILASPGLSMLEAGKDCTISFAQDILLQIFPTVCVTVFFPECRMMGFHDLCDQPCDFEQYRTLSLLFTLHLDVISTMIAHWQLIQQQVARSSRKSFLNWILHISAWRLLYTFDRIEFSDLEKLPGME